MLLLNESPSHEQVWVEEGGWDVIVGKLVLVMVCGVLVKMQWERNLLDASEAGFLPSLWVFGSNFSLKFVDGTALKEDIMFLRAVCTDAFCWETVCTGMARWGKTCSGSTVFCWMSEIPAVLALTGKRNVRFNLTEDPTYVYSLEDLDLWIQYLRGTCGGY